MSLHFSKQRHLREKMRDLLTHDSKSPSSLSSLKSNQHDSINPSVFSKQISFNYDSNDNDTSNHLKSPESMTMMSFDYGDDEIDIVDTTINHSTPYKEYNYGSSDDDNDIDDVELIIAQYKKKTGDSPLTHLDNNTSHQYGNDIINNNRTVGPSRSDNNDNNHTYVKNNLNSHHVANNNAEYGNNAHTDNNKINYKIDELLNESDNDVDEDDIDKILLKYTKNKPINQSEANNKNPHNAAESRVAALKQELSNFDSDDTNTDEYTTDDDNDNDNNNNNNRPVGPSRSDNNNKNITDDDDNDDNDDDDNDDNEYTTDEDDDDDEFTTDDDDENNEFSQTIKEISAVPSQSSINKKNITITRPFKPTNDLYETLDLFLISIDDNQLNLFSEIELVKMPEIYRALITDEFMIIKNYKSDFITKIEEHVYDRNNSLIEYIHDIATIFAMFGESITMGFNESLIKENTLYKAIIGNMDIVSLMFNKANINRRLKELIIYEIDVHINIMTLSLFLAIFNLIFNKALEGPFIEYNFKDVKTLTKQIRPSNKTNKAVVIRNNSVYKLDPNIKACAHCFKDVSLPQMIKSIYQQTTVLFCNIDCISKFKFSKN